MRQEQRKKFPDGSSGCERTPPSSDKHTLCFHEPQLFKLKTPSKNGCVVYRQHPFILVTTFMFWHRFFREILNSLCGFQLAQQTNKLLNNFAH